jgi:hypothetical protein
MPSKVSGIKPSAALQEEIPAEAAVEAVAEAVAEQAAQQTNK